jgi:carbamoyltransferase
MKVLGISSYLHNASAALVSDGVLLSAVEEERLNKEKYTNAFPYNSINWCLQENNITMDQVDAIALGWSPYPEILQSAKHFVRYFPKTLGVFKQNSTDAPIIPRLKRTIFLKSELIKHFGKNYNYPQIYYVQHHLAHAASAYFESGFEHAAVLVMDGLGDNYDSVSVWKANNNKLERIQNIKFPHSIGILYLCIQAYLGFPDNSGAGKIMGLSSYGDPSYANYFDDLVKFYGNGKFKLDLSMLQYHIYGNNKTCSDKFIKRYGPPRYIYDEIEKKHEDMAYALQKLTEKIILHICQYICETLEETNLCISGGVGLNCVANGAIAKEELFDNIYVSNAPHDGGTSIGAASYVSRLIQDIPFEKKVNNYSKAYVGPKYNDQEILKILSSNVSDNRYKYQKVDSPAKVAAENVSKGKIVAWFQGGLEFGPRALGNRSIIADPRDPQMKEILNERVKFREGFRPFAPSVLAEYASEYFEPSVPSPFMTIICDVIPEKREKIPAITHVDGTARVQTVQLDQNPIYYEMINEFFLITGIPMILNTSLNIKGMPICCSPEDALNCLLLSGIDCLVIGNYYVWKTEVQPDE